VNQPKLLLIGRNGQVGWELARTLAPLGRLICPTREELDLTDLESVRRTVRQVRPDVIVNAAAYTRVDQAECERELAFLVNARAPAVLAEIARQLGSLLVHYSTDYVFDGQSSAAYVEDSPPAPLNVYGESKLAGEQGIQATGARYLILRTSWIYATRGRNFLRMVLRAARDARPLRIVNDQVGVPTWSRMIAEATAAITAGRLNCDEAPASDNDGIYHLCAAGQTSWFGFAVAILEECIRQLERRGADSRVYEKALASASPITTPEYPTAAQRPAFSVLCPSKLLSRFRLTLPPWREQLRLAVEEINVYQQL